MNQRRRGGALGESADNHQSAPSLLNNRYSASPHQTGYSSASQYTPAYSSINGAQPLQKGLYDTPPPNSVQAQSYYQSLSRSAPVQKPRSETAQPLHIEESFQRTAASTPRSSSTRDNSVRDRRYYSVEEHHDSSLLPVTTNDYTTIQKGARSSKSEKDWKQTSLCERDDSLEREVEALLASHSPSTSTGNKSQNGEHLNNAARTSSSALKNLLRFTGTAQFPASSPSNEPSFDHFHQHSFSFTKPQVYRVDGREVERYTYRPTGLLPTSLAGGAAKEQPHYPIVELSVPKPSLPNSLPSSFKEDPYTDTQPSWLRLSPSVQFDNHHSSSHHEHRTSNNFTEGYRSLQSSSPSFRQGPFNRSIYDQPTQRNQDIALPTSGNYQERLNFDQTIDISSLDELLDDSLSDEDMSRTTKEWQTSFSSVRNLFGKNRRSSQDEATSSLSQDFTTNGSLTVPRRTGLSKSASQGSMSLGRQNDSPAFGRSVSSNNGFERRAAEAPEFRRPTARNELGEFWVETVRNRSESSSVHRTLNYMTAAQRLEMLHEPVDGPQYRRPGTRENLAARRAQFLKETDRVNSSPYAERAPSGRSTPMPNGLLSSGSIRIDVSQGSTSLENGNVTPNFSDLDSAVAELGTTESARNSNRSGGCARFPTGDLGALSPPAKKVESHSPSPDATSDASSNYNAPSGLPHPKPKHNIREQLIQAGFEPRANSHISRFGGRFNSSPNFPVPTNGSVASRISEFEKRPGAPNLLQIACALNGMPQKSEPTPIRSPVGPMSPRSSVYRTKPVIHADLTGVSPKTHSETNGGAVSIFEFPPAKGAQFKDDVSYCSRDGVPTKNDTQMTRISSNLEKISVDSPKPLKVEDLKARVRANDSQQTTQPTLIERRLEKKNGASARKDIPPTSPSSSYVSTVHRNVRRAVDVPRFYFPKGKPVSMLDNEAALRRVSDVFSRIGGKADLIDMAEVCKAAGIPIYWKRAVYDSCCGPQPKPITLSDFSSWWSRMTATAHDEAARFIYTVVGPHRNYLTKEDFAPLLQDLIESFPGLHFLREAQEFHSRYVETVTVRIFWSVNRSWSGRITSNELRRSNFLETVRKLEATDDINTITDYFSYEHFYVIYCKFYELDKDHNLIINKIDMSQHANGALPPRIIDRIFSGAVTRAPGGRRIREAVETITYTDFVAFLLAEEDKKHPTSIEYWFRCLDLDGDGQLSLYEMEYFYNGVKGKMDQHNIDSMRFEDVVCNLLDLIRPRQPNVITLSDLKRCSLCTRFFNTFVNWIKYYEQECSEGERATVTDGEEELSDWDRYCLEEYEALMADEQDNDETDDINLNLDDDDEMGANVNLSVNMPLRDFTDARRSPVLEAL